ncbi:MAG: DinB family protein [Actinomycetota bacterium]|nr:DinB family protein [Actinomycetota bacterium]
MDVAELLCELYGRIPPLAGAAVDGLSAGELAEEPWTGANPVGWLVWHLARVQDHHVAEILDTEQLWERGNWASGVGLEADPHNTGYRHSPEDVRAVRPESPGILLDYLDAVQSRTVGMLRGLGAADLDRVVDRRWDPPVTLGVRLVSIADDSLQHAGQAAYARGVLVARRLPGDSG